MKLNFVIGIGRSGTTLLSMLLDKQDQTQSLHDIPFIPFFYKTLRNTRKLSQRDHELLTSYFSNFTNDSETIIKIQNEIPKIDSVSSYSDLIEKLFNIITTKKNTIQFFDKEPSYTLHVDLLVKLFPKAKFIYMVRDPRANFLSRKENPNNRTTNIYFNCYRWKFHNKEGIKAIKKYPDKIKTIRYEDLVEAPEKVLHDISKFIGFKINSETFSEPIIHFEKIMVDTDINPTFYKNHKHKLSKEINKDRLDSWEFNLTGEEIAICDAICFNEASFFGYEKSTTNIRTPKNSTQQFIKAKYDIYKEYILTHISASRKLKRIKRLKQ